MDEKSHKVFISHGKEDTWLAAQIATRAQDCGAVTFLDEVNIAKGDDFQRIIREEVDNSSELIAIFTPWSAQRFWVWIEIGAAWGKDKRIVAVMYGLSIADLEKLGGSRAILEKINIVELNDIDRYFLELKRRVEEV